MPAFFALLAVAVVLVLGFTLIVVRNKPRRQNSYSDIRQTYEYRPGAYAPGRSAPSSTARPTSKSSSGTGSAPYRSSARTDDTAYIAHSSTSYAPPYSASSYSSACENSYCDSGSSAADCCSASD